MSADVQPVDHLQRGLELLHAATARSDEDPAGAQALATLAHAHFTAATAAASVGTFTHATTYLNGQHEREELEHYAKETYRKLDQARVERDWLLAEASGRVRKRFYATRRKDGGAS